MSSENDKIVRRVASTLLKKTKYRAKKKGIDFSLSKDWLIEKLKKGICEITGQKFLLNYIGSYEHNPMNPSIDRVDNMQGYTEDNCKIVCWFVNNMKSEYSQKDFENFINILYETVIKQN